MHFTLSDLVTDITQNGAESGADLVELEIRETEKGANGNPEFRFIVKDNGKGMSPESLKRAQDPFVTDGIKHPHRKVGLGVPFLIQTAEQSGGGWKMESVKAEGDAAAHGTEVSAWFDISNVDTPPVGDLSGMFRMVLLFQGPAEIVIKRALEMGENQIHYEVRKTELAEALGGDLEDTQSQILLDRYLRSLEVNDDQNDSDQGEENG
ncbi:ATPase [Spirochaetia bacterium]|nr:ATPase [Spirochaetia bacterium]